MGSAAGLLFASLRHRFGTWIGITLGFFVAYYAVLLLGVTLRFGDLPNYVETYDVVEAYRLIWVGTDAWSDALPLLFDEPLAEIGFQNEAYYGIAEWNLTLIPLQASVTFLLGLLLATFVSVRSEARHCLLDPAAGGTTMVGVGSVLTSLTTATISWIVCCATPSWVVALAMFGLSSGVALALEPAGPAIGALGIALVGTALVVQLRAASTGASHEAHSPFENPLEEAARS